MEDSNPRQRSQRPNRPIIGVRPFSPCKSNNINVISLISETFSFDQKKRFRRFFPISRQFFPISGEITWHIPGTFLAQMDIDRGNLSCYITSIIENRKWITIEKLLNSLVFWLVFFDCSTRFHRVPKWRNLVDALGSGSSALCGCGGSSPPFGIFSLREKMPEFRVARLSLILNIKQILHHSIGFATSFAVPIGKDPKFWCIM